MIFLCIVLPGVVAWCPMGGKVGTGERKECSV